MDTANSTPGKAPSLIFAALVVATFGAFFVTQRLKNAPTLLQRLSSTPYASPNGDGRKDVARVGALVSVATSVEVLITSPDGTVVRRLPPRPVARYRRFRASWDGLDLRGKLVADGRYRFTLVLGSGRRFAVPAAVIIDTKPPKVSLDYVGLGEFRLETSGRRRTIRAFRRKAGRWEEIGAPRVLRFGAVRARTTMVDSSATLIVASARDRAGNVGYSAAWDRRRSAPDATVESNVR